MLIQSKLFYLSSGPPPTHIVPLLKVQTQKQKQVYLINMRNQMCVCYIYFNFITAFSKIGGFTDILSSFWPNVYFSYNPCDLRGTCGPNAKCSVVASNAVCSCPPGFSGRKLILNIKAAMNGILWMYVFIRVFQWWVLTRAGRIRPF